jgi:hypothetical protein
MLALPCLLSLLCLPDIVPPDRKTIAVERRLDLALLPGPACRIVEVKHGDTLSAIAAARLGDARRWPEIAACNRGLVADDLRPGMRLWVPPARTAESPPADAPAPRALLVGFVSRDQTRIAGLPYDDAPLPATRGGELLVYLVDLDAVPAVDVVHGRDQRDELDRLVTAGRAQRLTCAAPGNLVDRASSAVRRVDTFRVQPKQGGGTEVVLAASERFDAQGRVLAAAPDDRRSIEGNRTPDDEGPGGALLLGLAAAAGATLLRRGRRSSPTTVPA